MKYYVRTEAGKELVLRNGTQVVLLFRQCFLSPDDQLRQEGSERWRRIGDIPEYASLIRSEAQDRHQFKWLLYISTALTFAGLLYGMLTR